MDIDEVMKGARDAMTVGRVFGEPVERGGVTVIPVAKVLGGSGGGGGEDASGDNGGGGGFGLRVKPVGVYVIEHGKVRWVPAVDPTRVLLALGLTATAVGLTATALIGAAGVALRARDARAARVAQALVIAKKIAQAKARARR